MFIWHVWWQNPYIFDRKEASSELFNINLTFLKLLPISSKIWIQIQSFFIVGSRNTPIYNLYNICQSWTKFSRWNSLKAHNDGVICPYFIADDLECSERYVRRRLNQFGIKYFKNIKRLFLIIGIMNQAIQPYFY